MIKMDRRRMRPEELGRNMICLGKAGENGALALAFDCAEWLREYPEGIIRLYVQTAGEEAYYPPLGTEGTDRIWVIDSEKATKTPGNGVIELLLIDAESGTTIKSATGYTTVKRSPSAGLEETDGEPGYVRYDAAQTLTDDQKAQARANIGAGTGSGNGEGTGEPGADGADGGYYTPAVSAEGDLTWTPSKADMPAAPSANIKGPAGRDGNDGATGPQGHPGKDGADGRGIVSIERTSGDGSAGTVDTYTITYTDGSTTTYTVTNGKNGQNASGDGTLSVEIDETLSISGAAADAKMTGDRLNELKEANAEQDERLTALEQATPNGSGGFSQTLKTALYNLLMDAVYQSSGHASDKAALEELLTGNSGGEDEPVVTYYTITKNLTNVSIDNGAASIASGSAYSATLTADTGYTLGEVTVTMGGETVAVTDGIISITSVTGNIVITATATANSSGGYEWESSVPYDLTGKIITGTGLVLANGAEKTGDTLAVSDYLNCFDVDHIFVDTGYAWNLHFYDASKNWMSAQDRKTTVPDNAVYFRISSASDSTKWLTESLKVIPITKTDEVYTPGVQDVEWSNAMLIKETGEVADHNGYRTSDFICANGAKCISADGYNAISMMCVYDAYKNHLYTKTSLMVPTDFDLDFGQTGYAYASYIRVCNSGATTREITLDDADVYTVTRKLTGASTLHANAAKGGTTYTNTVTANSGYTLEGATVSITMGGVDITESAYTNGEISIANVTGNIVITITAVATTE